MVYTGSRKSLIIHRKTFYLYIACVRRDILKFHRYRCDDIGKARDQFQRCIQKLRDIYCRRTFRGKLVFEYFRVPVYMCIESSVDEIVFRKPLSERILVGQRTNALQLSFPFHRVLHLFFFRHGRTKREKERRKKGRCGDDGERKSEGKRNPMPVGRRPRGETSTRATLCKTRSLWFKSDDHCITNEERRRKRHESRGRKL